MSWLFASGDQNTIQVTGEKRTGYKGHAGHNVTPIQNENSDFCQGMFVLKTLMV